MRRQLPPSHLKAFPQRQFLGENTVIVNHYSGIEKAIPVIPAIPSLPGFKTSAGMLLFFSLSALGWSCDYRSLPQTPSQVAQTQPFLLLQTR